MRLGDVQLAFPFILLAIAVLGVVANRSAWHIIVVLGIPGWIIYARVVRSRVLAEKEKDYVEAARASGRPSGGDCSLRVPLGVAGGPGDRAARLRLPDHHGVDPQLPRPRPPPTRGDLGRDPRRGTPEHGRLALAANTPRLAIVLTVLSINLLGDGVAKFIDPAGAKGGFRRLGPRPTRREGEPDETPPLLRVKNLSVEFPDKGGKISAVRDVSFDLKRGEILGMVGESGSGKSVTAAAIVQLVDPPGRITSGEILLAGEDVVQVSDRRMRQLRGRSVAMIFQNPSASLNPVLTVGYQMRETLRTIGIPREDVEDTVVRVLTTVGIPDPKRVVRQYPFELSGGMNQRVMIAMALAAQPQLLIADEPTTALDTTTQEQILSELVDLARSRDISLLLITHDIALVSQYADRILVLYAGEVCETGPIDRVISSPAHPYTRALLESVPRVEVRTDRLRAIPGELPDPRATAVGCPFAARCPHVMDICRVENPFPVEIATAQWAACHLWTEDRAEVMRT
jgi:peptide/nickel transport system permease protein